jgi:hypothetical protein
VFDIVSQLRVYPFLSLVFVVIDSVGVTKVTQCIVLRFGVVTKIVGANQRGVNQNWSIDLK